MNSRRRFLEHARAWWDAHRHRMAPEVELTISKAVTERRLTLMAAKIVDISPGSAGATIRFRRRGDVGIESLEVDTIIDCTGIAAGSGSNSQSGGAQPVRPGASADRSLAHGHRGRFRLCDRQPPGGAFAAAVCNWPADARGFLGNHRDPRYSQPVRSARRTTDPECRQKNRSRDRAIGCERYKSPPQSGERRWSVITEVLPMTCLTGSPFADHDAPLRTE